MSKPAPRFWWDIVHCVANSAVIVQSDYPGGEELARFEQSSLCVSLEAEIAQAEALIDDFESGRKTPEWKKEKAK